MKAKGYCAGITTFPGSRSGHSGCGASEGHLPVNDAGGQPAPVAPVKNPFVRLLNARKVRRPGAVKVPQRPNSDPPIGTRDQSLTLPGEDPDTQARGPTKLTVPLSKRISRASQLNGISSDPMQQPIRKKPKTRHRNAEDCNHTKPGAASRAQHYHLGPGEAGAIHNGHDHVVEEAVTRPKLDRKPVQHSSGTMCNSGSQQDFLQRSEVPGCKLGKNNESSEHVEEAVHCDNSAADKSNDLLEEWEEAARADSDAACRSNDLLKAWEEAARQDAKANAGKSDDLLEAWEEAARQDAEANEAHGKDVQEASDEAAGQRPQCGKRAPGIGRVPDRTTRKKKKRPVIILAWPTDTQKSCQPKSPDAEHSNTTPPGQQAQQSKCRLSPDVHPSSTASTEAGPLHSARSSSDHEVLACSPQIPKKAQKEAATPPSLPHMAQLHQQLQLFMSAAASSGEFSCVPPKIMESVKQCLELMQQHTFSEVRDPTRHAYGAEQHDHEDPTPCTECPPTSAQCRAKGRAGDPLASQHARPEDATAGGGESAEQAAAADLPAAPVHVRTTAAEQGCAGEYGARVTMPAPVRAERQTAPAQGPAQHTDKDAPAGPTAPPPPDASYRQYSEQCQAAFITGQKSSAADSAPKAQSVPSHQASAPDNFTERTSAAEHDASDRLPDVKGVQGAPASNLLPDLQQPQHAESDMLVDEAISNVGIARRHDPEVEAAEWARRHAEVQRQRQEKKAERLAAAERAAVKRAREQRERETAEMELRNRLRADKQRHLRRIVLKEFNLRQALNALNIPVSAGPAGDRAALRRARIYYHPDQSRKRGDSLADQIMSEEVFKLLGSLA